MYIHPGTDIATRQRIRREQQLQMERDNYQRAIQRENIESLRLQNAALSSSIQAMGGRVPGQSVAVSTGGTQQVEFPAITWPQPAPQITPQPEPQLASGSGSANQEFPSLAEIQSMIESSQRKAEEDFQGKVDLLQTQERQKEEEDRLSASNAAAKRLNYERTQSDRAWESALRGR